MSNWNKQLEVAEKGVFEKSDHSKILREKFKVMLQNNLTDHKIFGDQLLKESHPKEKIVKIPKRLENYFTGVMQSESNIETNFK
jgi:hypothetical protein